MRLGVGLTPRWVTLNSAPDARFRIRPMTAQDRLELTMHIEKRGDLHYYPAQAQVQAIRACLLEWDGVTDADGQPVEYTPAHLQLIEDEVVLLELFGEVNHSARLQPSATPEDDEAGN